MSSIIPVNRKCNQNCIYCSSYGASCPSDEEIKKQILEEKDQIVFTGGEPLMSRHLLKFVGLAKANEVSEIELQSNGTLFYYKGIASKLLDAGVTIFNIGLPSHKRDVCEQITQSKGLFDKRIQGIKNLLELGASVRITMVMCSLNCDHLLGFAKFVHKNFPGIKILEFNSVKLRGRALENKWLAPDLNKLEPKLKKALGYCREHEINALVDGVPLCHLQGFEEYSVDLAKILGGKTQRLHAEKERAPQCKKCSLKHYCLGPRKGYLELLGEGQVKPLSIEPKTVLQRIGLFSSTNP